MNFRQGPLTYPDVNIVLEAVQALLRTYREARKRDPGASLGGLRISDALMAAASPQARGLAGALEQGTLVSSELLRHLVAGKINERIEGAFGTKARIQDPKLLRKLAETLTGDGPSVEHGPAGQMLSTARRAAKDTRELRNYLRLAEQGHGDPVVALALGPVREQLEAVAPQTLKSSLLLERPWHANGIDSDSSGIDVAKVPADRVAALIRDRDRTAVDFEDLLHLAIAADASRVFGTTVVLATGDQRLAEALTQVRLHSGLYPAGPLSNLEVEHYAHEGGAWKAAGVSRHDTLTPTAGRAIPHPVGAHSADRQRAVGSTSHVPHQR